MLSEADAQDEAPCVDLPPLSRIERALNVAVRQREAARWPLRTAPFFASARTRSPLETIEGFGSGATAYEARLRAVMECTERYAQFGRVNPPIAAFDSYRSLSGEAISPAECGLYSARQYATAGFGLTPFSADAPLEWVRMFDLASGASRLLPVEFVWPRVSLKRPRLVMESSSGTAAHLDPAAATRAALCEVIERDCLQLFWYRRPSTAAIAIEDIPAPALCDDLRRVQRMGFVVTVGSLTYDLDVACCLIVGIKGDSFICGSGCHPDRMQALAHAVTELGQSLRQLTETPAATVLCRSLLDIRTPTDHYGLFNRGPLHPMLREVLAETLVRAESRRWFPEAEAPESDAHAIQILLKTLRSRDLHAYGIDLTPPGLSECGVYVTRVVVPGLIPIHFGFNRLRMGCRRLWGADAPGRLRTLLPHPFA